LSILFRPEWTHFALQESGGILVLGDPRDAFLISDTTVQMLLKGGDFRLPIPPADLVDGGPQFYTPDEIGHLRDVRFVLWTFLALGAASFLFFMYTTIRWGKAAWLYRAQARGAASLIVAVAVLAVVGGLAFGIGFELFHRVLFPGGNWEFPPDSRLIRLYPYAFWQMSAAAFGVLGILGGLAVWAYARRRARSLEQGGTA
jgi:hypothetical protein